MYKVAICDDENIFLDSIAQMTDAVLKELHAQYTIDVYTDPKRLIAEMTGNKDAYDLVLLDIVMRPMNGLELAAQLRSQGCPVSIIFITSTGDYSLDGYKVFPIHYIVKPVEKDELKAAIVRDYNGRFMPRHIHIQGKQGSVVLPIDDIPYIESINRAVLIHSRREKEYTEYCGTLKMLMQSLPADIFVQCHKSFILNISAVKKISRSSAQLSDHRQVPVGRAYYEGAMRLMIDYYCLK